ncbi:MAG: M23 family metallopeptidase [Ruaniaceae bacterium]|nr:M23 family metallopeptidase [Ruaniaceae bacterium]
MKVLLIALLLATAPLAAAPIEATSAAVFYDWPSGGEVQVLREFAPPEVRWGAGHRGVDLDLAPGDPVLVAADGVVAFAGMVAGRPVISIDHADGIRTTYEPVEASVPRGAPVAVGQEIGTLIAGHEPHGGLHWGARVGDDYIDPLGLLVPRTVRLYPLDVPVRTTGG